MAPNSSWEEHYSAFVVVIHPEARERDQRNWSGLSERQTDRNVLLWANTSAHCKNGTATDPECPCFRSHHLGVGTARVPLTHCDQASQPLYHIPLSRHLPDRQLAPTPFEDCTLQPSTLHHSPQRAELALRQEPHQLHLSTFIFSHIACYLAAAAMVTVEFNLAAACFLAAAAAGDDRVTKVSGVREDPI